MIIFIYFWELLPTTLMQKQNLYAKKQKMHRVLVVYFNEIIKKYSGSNLKL